MGVKGSKHAIASRFLASDFFFGESAHLGLQAEPTAMHSIDMAAGKPGQPPSRLLAIGCADGSVYVYGADGVHVRLYESVPPEPPVPAGVAASAGSSASAASVLAVFFLSPLQLVSVHARVVKLWSVATSMEVFALHVSDLPPLTRAGSLAQAAAVPMATDAAQMLASEHYQLTCAAQATEFDGRFVWLGTAQGEVLLFDALQRRLSAFVVPLLPDVLQHASLKPESASAAAAAATNALPPTAVTCIAQLPTDSSQLLIGYACDLVLSYHIGTRKLHRTYKRAGCGGVTALCWELQGAGVGGAAPVAADHFISGHRNGLVAVWKRKYQHSPSAVFFLSQASGPRAPITRLRWSTRSAGFFLSGGHLTQLESAKESVDTGALVFVSGAKWEHRKVCASSVATLPPPATAGAAPSIAPALHGIRDFWHVLMPSPSPPPAAPGAPPAAPKLTPAFICLLASGSLSIFFPSIQPPVPPMPLTDQHETPADSVQLVTAGDDAQQADLRALLGDLARSHPSAKLFTSLVRQSLAQQALWPLTGGVSSAAMAKIEAEEDAMFKKLTLVSAQGATPPPPTSAPAALPSPALLLSTHSGASASIRFFDATSPFELQLLAVLPLPRLLAPGARVTATKLCLARRELIVGTSNGEVLLFRLAQAKPAEAPAPAAAAAPDTAPASAPAEAPAAASTAPAAPASPTAAAAPAASAVTSPSRQGSPAPAADAVSAVAAAPSATPAPAPVAAVAPAQSAAAPAVAAAPVAVVEFVWELVLRVPFSSRPISLLLYCAGASKYFVSDDESQFALLRPDGAFMKQTIPGARITTAHFSSEALLQAKGPTLPSSLFLYVCAADGSLHVFCALAEAKLMLIPSLTGAPAASSSDAQAAEIVFMDTVKFSGGQATQAEPTASVAPKSATGAPGSAPADDTRQYVICCTTQSIKLLSGGGTKEVQSLLSLRTAEPIKLAFLVSSPHLIAKRDEAASSPPAADTPTAASASPATPAASPTPPAKELCLAIVDAAANLHVYSVSLKCMLSVALACHPAALSAASLSMASDGRMAFRPSPGAITMASMFPPKHYGLLAPPARLLPPSMDALFDAAELAAQSSASEAAPAPAGGSGWFSSLLPVAASHESLFAPPLYSEAQLDACARATSTGRDGDDEDAPQDAADAYRAQLAAGESARAQLDAAAVSKSAAASSTSASSSAAPSDTARARAQVATTQQQMAQNKDLAAANVRRAEEVADKSEIMAAHAGDFLAQAKKLRQQQQSSWW